MQPEVCCIGRLRLVWVSAVMGTDPAEIILDSIADGVFAVDRLWRITSFNNAAEKTSGTAEDMVMTYLDGSLQTGDKVCDH